MKQLQNNYTTPEQSKQLLELGVPRWSADCRYDYFGESYDNEPLYDDIPCWGTSYCEEDMPCWSAGRLMEIYDICFPDNGDWPNTQKWSEYTKTYNLLKYAIDCIEVAVEKDYIDFSKLED